MEGEGQVVGGQVEWEGIALSDMYNSQRFASPQNERNDSHATTNWTTRFYNTSIM